MVKHHCGNLPGQSPNGCAPVAISEEGNQDLAQAPREEKNEEIGHSSFPIKMAELMKMAAMLNAMAPQTMPEGFQL